MTDRLSSAFAALADPTRRAILARLALARRRSPNLRAFRYEPAGGLEASQGARTGGHDRAESRKAVAAAPAGAGSAEGSRHWLEYYRQFWEQSFDRLDAYLKMLQAKEVAMARKAETPVLELHITRLFDAPRELVFKL